MSVQTTNRISQIVLAVGIESGAVAWAAHALNNPIGALGGALFGAVRYVSQIPLGILGIKYLNANHPQADAAAKTVAAALQFFGSYAIAWGVLAAAGFTLTLTHMVSITLYSILTAIGLEVLLSCLSLNPAHR